MFRYLTLLFWIFHIATLCIAQTPGPSFKGQDPIKSVPTQPRAVMPQWKGIFANQDSTLLFSNNFPGGRLSGVIRVNDSLYECLIAPENTPINPSPWYAFKVWGKQGKEIVIRLRYLNQTKHRYMPKLSKDGLRWKETSGETLDKGRQFQFTLQVSPDTTWISAQELLTTRHVEAWVKSLSVPLSVDTMGFSRQKRPLKVYRMGNLRSENVMIILGRQHPPEVTGHLALAAFVETLAGGSGEARRFRKDFQVFFIPLANPDGVENGFWRHTAGGVDMNRDWADFNHPETRAIRDYFEKTLQPGQTVYFMIDFHSTYDDIYYTLAPDMKRNTDDLGKRWMEEIRAAIPDYAPRVKVLYLGPPTVTAYSYFYETYRSESLIYEIGDATPREFIKEKSAKSALALMRLLQSGLKTD